MSEWNTIDYGNPDTFPPRGRIVILKMSDGEEIHAWRNVNQWGKSEFIKKTNWQTIPSEKSYPVKWKYPE